jgi:hypothetical protein
MSYVLLQVESCDGFVHLGLCLGMQQMDVLTHEASACHLNSGY